MAQPLLQDRRCFIVTDEADLAQLKADLLAQLRVSADHAADAPGFPCIYRPIVITVSGERQLVSVLLPLHDVVIGLYNCGVLEPYDSGLP